MACFQDKLKSIHSVLPTAHHKLRTNTSEKYLIFSAIKEESLAKGVSVSP